MTILAATDRSQNSRAALRLAARLATALSEPLVVMLALELWERDISTILPTFEDVELQVDPRTRELAEKFVAETLPGVEPVLHIAVGHPPAERIIEAASEVDASLIVVGTSGQSQVTEAFFGSTVSALVRRSSRPVLAVPPHFESQIVRILAPVDFSECSRESLRYAGQLSTRLGAELFVQHSAPLGAPAIAPPIAYLPESSSDVLRVARTRLSRLIDDAELPSAPDRVLTDIGPPHADILRAVQEHEIGLVVMGTHGRTGLARFFLGSTAERMLRDRTCPVLVVRDPMAG